MRFTSTSLDETLLSEKFCRKHNTRVRWNINTGSKWFTGNWNGQLELLTVLIINKWSHSIKDILHFLIISLIRIRNHSLFSMGGGGRGSEKFFWGCQMFFRGNGRGSVVVKGGTFKNWLRNHKNITEPQGGRERSIEFNRVTSEILPPHSGDKLRLVTCYSQT